MLSMIKITTILLTLLGIIQVLTPAHAGGVKTQKGITYAPSGQKLNLCLPTTDIRKTAVIFIHGGGFSTGNRGQMQGYCKLFAKGGFTSVTVDYRLTKDGHTYPAANEDVAAAVEWVKAQAGGLGLDPNKVVLVGYSAGATLALRVGLADGAGVAAVIAAAGVVDIASVQKSTPHARLKQDLAAYLGNTPSQVASPLGQASRGDPPVFLFHGKRDELVPIWETIKMADALKAQKVKVLLRVFDDVGHEILLPNKNLKQVLHEMTRFLQAVDAR